MSDKNLIAQYCPSMKPIPTALQADYQPKDKVRCILFDVYGTLFISASGDIGLLQPNTDKQRHLQHLIDDYGLGLTVDDLVASLTSTIQKTHQIMKSQGVDYPEVDIVSIWKSVIPRSVALTEPMIHEFAIRFELITNPVFPMPGLDECLQWCRNQGIIPGIVSNAQFYTPLLFKWFLEQDLTRLGFLEELVLFSYRFGIAKPDPTLFRTAADRLQNMGIPAHNVVYLGNDLLNDMLPASQIGFQTALFAGDARSLRLRGDDPRCRNTKPDMVITDLKQVTAWA